MQKPWCEDNNRYQIVYTGNSDVAMDGAEATRGKIQKTEQAHMDYMRVPK